MAIQRRVSVSPFHRTIAARLLAAGTPTTRAAATGPLPSAADIATLADALIGVFFPETGRAPLASGGAAARRDHLGATIEALERRIEDAVFLGLHRRCVSRSGASGDDGCRRRARAIARRMVEALPGIRALLLRDVEAAFEADPAATGTDEIIACYPGLFAIAIYRSAHKLLGLGAQVIPRMLGEHVHSRTGVDIHPGATIGASFFIDHGTGLVIGETTEIGDRVRIYQGVTLGALSVRRHSGRGAASADAPPAKRHPTIEDDVIIYANATILGGETVIGRGAVVGGNAWITYSVPPGIRVGVGT
jgi:serine O-acetyltransferase